MPGKRLSSLRLPALTGRAKHADLRAREFYKEMLKDEEEHNRANSELLGLVTTFRDQAEKKDDLVLLALTQTLVVLATDQVIQTTHQKAILTLLSRQDHMIHHLLSQIDPTRRGAFEQALKLMLADHALRISQHDQIVEDLHATLGDVYSRLSRPLRKEDLGGSKPGEG